MSKQDAQAAPADNYLPFTIVNNSKTVPYFDARNILSCKNKP